jgi:hypothetical protein
MPSFAVTVTNNATPAIVLTMTGNTTYTQFKNSLGNFNYEIEKFYLFSTNLNQISGGFKFMKYDSDGNQNFQTVLSVIDPYQNQNSIFVETKERSLVIDGRDSANFNMQPNTTLAFKIYANRVTNQDELSGEDNFTMFEDVSGQADFFDDYKDYL